MTGLSSTQRTIRLLKDSGIICAIVEKFNSHVGPHGIRQDLFGIIDILALDPVRGVVGIQCCTTSFKKHIDKIIEEKAQNTIEWLKTPGTKLEIYGWRKVKMKRGGKAVIWQPRIAEITLGIHLGDGKPILRAEEKK